MSERSPPPSPSALPSDELEELADELRRRARPGERLAETFRRLAEDTLERRRQTYFLEQILEGLPVNLFAKDSDHRYVFAKLNVRGMTYAPSEVLGKTDFDLLPQAAARTIRASDERVRSTGGLRTEELTLELSGTRTAHILVGKTVARFEETGEQVLVGFSLDITERKRIEQELESKIALIERQQAAIRSLSTPILEIWNEVLTTPMLGVLDRARALELEERLLAEVSRKGARFVIVDLTGVDAVDMDTAAHLLRLIEAARMLGAEGILTGIAPSIARSMVALGIDLATITTRATLRDGLRYCIQQMREGRVP